MIVVDTLRYDAISAQTNPSPLPFFDDMRNRSVSFTRAYSTHDNTPESHFSLLTGFLSGLGTDLDRPESSLSYQLRQLGYRTLGISANGNLSIATAAYLSGFQIFDCLYDLWLELDPTKKTTLTAPLDRRLQQYGVLESEVNRAILHSSFGNVLARLQERLGENPAPFFLFLNLFEPHDPYLPDPNHYSVEAPSQLPNQFSSDLRARDMGPPLDNPEGIQDPELRRQVRQQLEAASERRWALAHDLSEAALSIYKRRYLAEVADMDRALSELMEFLEKRQLLENTLVILTSDHGESFGEDGFLTHSLSNQGNREANQHVPLFFRFPSQTGIAPREMAEPVSIADIPPTIYDLLALDWSPLAQRTEVGNFGRSLMNHLTGSKTVTYQRTVSVTGQAPSPDQQEQLRIEKLKRLRALGYLN